MAHEQMIDDGR